MTITITCADAVAWCASYAGEKFHAMLCDPPYHLTSIVKRFGAENAAPNKTPVFGRVSKGFMGKQWDGGDVAFDPRTWEAFANVLHPGAFGMAFASSRGWHRLAVAIEDGGFIIHPSIFGWAYGSGFPKATRVKHNTDTEYLAAFADNPFDGHRYGLQALKPALEPIIVFQKTYENAPTSDIMYTGAGALNIDGARIGTEPIPSNQWTDAAHPFGGGAGNEYETVMNAGRWPSNFILMDDAAAQRLDEQSGHLVSGNPSGAKRNTGGAFLAHANSVDLTGYGDEGGASRFFYRVQQDIDAADPVHYCAKASGEERNAGLDGMPMHMNPHSPNAEGGAGLRTANNRSGDYVHNPHPTVKPLGLCRYLAALLLPPAAYAPRRLFVPFAGVASECIGAWQAGWEEIEGIELTEEYIPIANARKEYWLNAGWQLDMFGGA